MTHTRIAPLAALLACTAAITLTACDNKTPAPTPSTSTTAPITALPTPVGSTTASTSTGALYAQAVAVYRKNFAGSVAIAKRGGLALSAPTPAVMTETLTGDALTKQLNEMHNVRLHDLKYVSGDIKLVWVRPFPGERVGAAIGIESCEDGTAFITDEKGKRAGGVRLVRTSWYAPVSGALKMEAFTTHRVATCAG